jgi:hypothetical protein
MALKDLEVTDMLKIAAMLLLYTVYVTWWASSIQAQLDSLETHMMDHLEIENPIYQNLAIKSLVKATDLHTEILGNMAADHSGCKEVIKSLAVRLKHLEAVEAYEHERDM